jgi:molecular chaperone GrpE
MSTTDTVNQEEQKPNTTEEVKAEQPTPAEKTPEEKFAELNDKYLRLYADFENFRKRASKERLDLIKYAAEDVFKQIVPVLDDFERAFKSIATISDVNIIKQGEELIYNKFKGILTQNGLQEMKAIGEAFDSEIHEAVTNLPAPTEDKKGKVIEEVEKGYYINGKVIRHAKVIVGN